MRTRAAAGREDTSGVRALSHERCVCVCVALLARRKYPDSADGSTQAIDARDQELFADF